MGQDPAALREEIEQTRERMGGTVDALAYKADVPSRAKESIGGKVDSLKSKVTGVGSQISEGTPSKGELKQGTRQAASVVQENPLGLAIGAAAVGFLAGTLTPKTRIEDEHIGQVADQVKEQARQTGQEALEHGRQIAQEAAESASQKAQEVAGEVQENAQNRGRELSESAKDSIGQVQESAKG